MQRRPPGTEEGFVGRLRSAGTHPEQILPSVGIWVMVGSKTTTGMLRPMVTTWFGYSQPDMAGHVHDYGTKFLVAAGLLNLLAMVDAWEIATGKKD